MSPDSADVLPRGVLEKLADRELGHVWGDDNAQVTVVEIADFACPACRVVHRETWPLIRKMVRQEKVQFRVYSVRLPQHRRSLLATAVAECSGRQDERTHWRMRHEIFSAQTRWRNAERPDSVLLQLARRLALDVPTLRRCVERLRTGEWADVLRRSYRHVSNAGLRGVPVLAVERTIVSGSTGKEYRDRLADAIRERIGLSSKE